MLDPLSLLGLVIETVPALRWVGVRLAERQLEIRVVEPRGLENIANDWLALHRNAQHPGTFILPFILTVRNNSRENPERILNLGVRVKRRRGIRWERVANARIVNLQRKETIDIWVEPLKDHRAPYFAEGSITGKTLYNMLKGQPLVVELVLHRVGGIVRTFHHRLPWEWVCVPQDTYDDKST